ncbi:Antibiotic biosynthesis monooxygenase [plant metagenome]|uniref:Antibiotic biosynthesis monooxygenase n=1 Tax=plant metagenome TaxID=1297885 RepID=A0A484UVH8_9ZZZZ
MIAIIFELWPAEGRSQDYFSIAADLREDLARIDGFISVERFQSVSEPGKYLSLSFFRDEAAVQAWRNRQAHRQAQENGRGGVFANYRLRVASVMRDYGLHERAEAPGDSRAHHPAPQAAMPRG